MIRFIREVAADVLAQARDDVCPACTRAILQPHGGKHVCPECGYLQPCCNP